MLVFLILIAALVCFLLAAFGALARIGVGWLGLALITVTWLMSSWPGVH